MGVPEAQTQERSARAGDVVRIGYVEDHATAALGLAAILSEQPDLELVAIAPTVSALLAEQSEIDLAVLDLRLADGSTPRSNVEVLRSHNIETLILTGGEDRFLI